MYLDSEIYWVLLGTFFYTFLPLGKLSNVEDEINFILVLLNYAWLYKPIKESSECTDIMKLFKEVIDLIGKVFIGNFEIFRITVRSTKSK